MLVLVQAETMTMPIEQAEAVLEHAATSAAVSEHAATAATETTVSEQIASSVTVLRPAATFVVGSAQAEMQVTVAGMKANVLQQAAPVLNVKAARLASVQGAKSVSVP